jgi:hypothetical protein
LEKIIHLIEARDFEAGMMGVIFLARCPFRLCFYAFLARA